MVLKLLMFLLIPLEPGTCYSMQGPEGKFQSQLGGGKNCQIIYWGF